ncbi:MAG: hypothetical protein HFG11_07235 [Oscillibacter sp.]|jgi:hypothetical protein|nr:hypothetical protein [Oscillibacter sp.]
MKEALMKCPPMSACHKNFPARAGKLESSGISRAVFPPGKIAGANPRGLIRSALL